MFSEAGLIQSKLGGGVQRHWVGGRQDLLSHGRRKGLGVLAISILPRNEEHVNEMQISLYCPQLTRFCEEACWILRVLMWEWSSCPHKLSQLTFSPGLVEQFQELLARSQPQPLPSHL